jgi:cytoskeletal protein RodZ
MAKGNFGERLKRERELREVSMDELTKATRISTRFVEALENEDWAKLPGGVFGHGFVRTIARYLGLNEEALLSEYDMARADHMPPSSSKPEDRIPPPPKWLPVAFVAGFLVLLMALFFAGRFGIRRLMAYWSSRKSSAISTPVQTQSVATSPPAPESTPLDLSVSTSAPTHIRILADDKLALDDDLPPGENRHFSALLQFEVTAGDSSAVLLELNGKAMPPLGQPGTSGTMILSQKDLRQ